MIIAVTGASGSIGRELVPFLENLNHNVIKISSSIPSDGKKIYSYHDLRKKNISVKVDLFFHLASLNDSLLKHQIEDEVNLAREILSSLPSLSCKKLIFFSTSKVYGDNSLYQNSFNESSSLNPLCPYGIAKKLCEEFIFANASAFDVEAIIFRLPPVLNQSEGSNLGKLIKLAKTGMPILSIVQGDNNQRSFISINNIKTVLSHLIENFSLFQKTKIYNLSDDGFISLNELLRLVGRSRIYSLPAFFGNIILFIPFLKTISIKLYGNFVLENSKIKDEMNVKLKTTAVSLPIMYK